MLHAERHRRRHRLHTELVEQTNEIRIRHIVEDHEARVDRHRPPFFIDCDRVRVSAGVIVRVEQRHVEIAVEKIAASEAGNAGTDNGDGRHLTDRNYGWRLIGGLYWKRVRSAASATPHSKWRGRF